MTKQNLNQIKPLSLEINEQHQISLGGIKVAELAETYGTPLYLLCEETIRKRAQAYTNAFKQHYDNYQVIYASKALNCMAMCKIMEQEGLGLDVVSAGELHTALEAKFPPARIIFHGNNKSKNEVEHAIATGVTLVLDNRYELNLINDYLKANPDRKAQVLIRITPGIECHTHEYIKTGKIDSKFGFNINELDEIITVIKAEPRIKIRGLHAHIGSQIFETIPHKDTCKVLLQLYKDIKDKHGLEFEDINVGGGLGIMYTNQDDPPEIEAWVKIIADAIKAGCKELGLKEPRILTEPGRSMVGPAGLTVYKVGNIKDIAGVRKYVAVDGGMGDNARPIMYQAKYTAQVDAKDPKDTELVTVAGKYCESGDVLIRDVELAKMETGDLLVVYSTGAYNYSMASNYNRATKPALVLVKNGQSHTIVQAEDLDDLLRNDKVPGHL